MLSNITSLALVSNTFNKTALQTLTDRFGHEFMLAIFNKGRDIYTQNLPYDSATICFFSLVSMYLCNIKLKNEIHYYKFNTKEMNEYVNNEYCRFATNCNSILQTSILSIVPLNEDFVQNIGINSKIEDIKKLINTKISYPNQYPYSLVIDNLHCYFMALKNFKEIKENYSDAELTSSDTRESNDDNQ